jgi:hypothetical protein
MAQAARGAIPQNAPWLAEYLHEMTVFPNGKHDDQVDSTAQFLDWFKTRCRIPVSSNITAERPSGRAAPPAGARPNRMAARLCAMARRTEKTQMNRRSGAFYPESIISIGFGEICRAAKPGASSSETLSCPINST